MYTSNRRGRSGSAQSGRRRSSSGQKVSGARPGGHGRSKPGSSYHSDRPSGGRPHRGGRPSTKPHGGHGGGFSRGGRQGGGNKRKMPTFDPSQFINKNPVDVKEEAYVPKHGFGDFGLDKRLVATLETLGIISPSPIQDQIIDEVMAGRDVIGLAETGTGKTAAFLLPLLHHTINDPSRNTLILTPTRELAIQIEEELRRLSRGIKVTSVTCVGGVGIYPQKTALRQKRHFIIGTPGRVLDLIGQGFIKPPTIGTVVLDEADRMLDMGFVHDMRKILETTPKDRETLLFSATMPDEIKRIVHDFQRDPITVSVKKRAVTNNIAQDVVRYHLADKYKTLTDLLSGPEFTKVIVFGAMKHSVEKLSQMLTKSGIKAESIHGNKSHGQRQRSLKNFKDGRAKVLVATDVAARGIHVDDVSHVINYDLPGTLEDYVHRIGRTGRSDKRGKALTFVHQ